MQKTESQAASKKVALLRRKYHAEILPDWGAERGRWGRGTWSLAELDKIQYALNLMANCMGGMDYFIQGIGGVKITKSTMGSHGGEAQNHLVSFSSKGTFSAWTVVHEMAHAWDANHGWNLSRALEKGTGGFTSPILSKIKKFLHTWDAGPFGEENLPGHHGRLRGCNAAGYFYGDHPSGSNWSFNRKEDFAESVAMYVGWGRNNDLSEWAQARLNRYLLANGAKDKNFGVDNWADYRKFFYPQDGDYSTTKRWKFVDDLMQHRITSF